MPPVLTVRIEAIPLSAQTGHLGSLPVSVMLREPRRLNFGNSFLSKAAALFVAGLHDWQYSAIDWLIGQYTPCSHFFRVLVRSSIVVGVDAFRLGLCGSHDREFGRSLQRPALNNIRHLRSIGKSRALGVHPFLQS
jgi:hypothetical protein